MIRETVGDLLALAREKGFSLTAAGLAFDAVNALVALVVLLYASLVVFGSGDAVASFLGGVTGVETAAFRQFFRDVGGNVGGRRRAVVVALVIVVPSSFRLFRAAEAAFSEVYGRQGERSTVDRLVDSVLVLVAVTLTLLVLVALGTAFLFLGTESWWLLLAPIALWAAFAALCAPVYVRFSGEDVTAREVVPGVAFTAAAWTVATLGLRIYVGLSESVDLFGLVGGALLALTWLYILAYALLVGAALNALLAGAVDVDDDVSGPFD